MTLTRKSPLQSHKSALKAGEKKLRTRKCAIKGCGVRFAPRSITHKACGPEHAALIAADKREQEERRESRVRKEALKKRSDWLRETQTVFNQYRREWCKQNGFHTCPCCGIPLDWTGNGVDAGHYRSVGSAPHLRFTEHNVWAQRKQCNRYGAGRAVDYRIGLIALIGREAVEALESDNTPRKWTITELKALKAEYSAKLKALLAKAEG